MPKSILNGIYFYVYLQSVSCLLDRCGFNFKGPLRLSERPKHDTAIFRSLDYFVKMVFLATALPSGTETRYEKRAQCWPSVGWSGMRMVWRIKNPPGSQLANKLHLESFLEVFFLGGGRECSCGFWGG
jgi:hypothetical protein